MRFCDGFIHLFIFLYAVYEILLRLLSGHVLVIRVTRTDFQGNIGSDDDGIIAKGLEEDNNYSLFFSDATFDFCPVDFMSIT